MANRNTADDLDLQALKHVTVQRDACSIGRREKPCVSFCVPDGGVFGQYQCLYWPPRTAAQRRKLVEFFSRPRAVEQGGMAGNGGAPNDAE